jgi:nicotinamide mononucleotide transporter
VVSPWWSVERVAWDVAGHGVSFIEAAGTVTYLASVALVARRNVLTWPVGIVSVLLYASLFWQLRLYADAMEQACYVALGLAGWLGWARAKAGDPAPVPVRWSPPAIAVTLLLATAAASLVAGEGLSRVHAWWPGLFPEPADLPRIDAATTVASLVAMALTALRRTEAWLYWLAVDACGVVVYAMKGVVFVAGLYVVLFALATWGLHDWARAPRRAG